MNTINKIIDQLKRDNQYYAYYSNPENKTNYMIYFGADYKTAIVRTIQDGKKRGTATVEEFIKVVNKYNYPLTEEQFYDSIKRKSY